MANPKITVGKNQDQPVSPTGDNLKNTSPFERKQNTFRQLHNREVREVFSDVFDIPEAGIPYDPTKITPPDSPRRILRQDLLISDSDSFADMWLSRELLKFMKDDQTPLILPAYDEIPVSVKDKPSVHLHFIEKKSSAILNKRKRAEALISFRIMDRTISTITQLDMNILKREINQAFPSTYALKKGRIKYSYRDKENGYEFILALQSEAEAREVITKVLAIKNKTPDFELLRSSTSEQNFTTRKTITILGQQEKLPLPRPVCDCFLYKAVLKLSNLRVLPLIQRAV